MRRGAPSEVARALLTDEIRDGGTALPDWLTRNRMATPDTVAIWHEDETWTYQQLWEKATRLAGHLSSIGIPEAGYVAVLARRGLDVARVVHASIQGGFRLVPLNARLTADELAFQLDDAGVSAVLYDEPMSDLAHEAVARCHVKPILQCVGDEVPLIGTPTSRAHIRLDHAFCVIYTSGTTGKPKGAVLTFGNFLWSAFGSAIQLGLSRQENWLVPMPLYHVGGLSVLMRSVIYGTTASLLDRFDETLVNRLLDEFQITLVSVVPAMLRRLLAQREGMPYPSTLRTVLLGGSAADRPLLEQCQRLGVPVAQSYGLTEATSQVCTLGVQDSLRKIGSSGKPLLPTEVMIVDEHGAAVPALTPGEIAVRSPTVSRGYLNRTHAPRTDGWFHTGDIGYLDEEGYLFVLDRRTDLIVSGGENVYPAEIESVLLGHPDVLEVGVVAEPHVHWGQVPVAFVRLRDGSTAVDEDLRAWSQGALAKYKVPQRYIFVRELPRNASGKLLRRTLREWL